MIRELIEDLQRYKYDKMNNEENIIVYRDNKFTNQAQKDIHESDVNHLRDAHRAACYVAKKYDWYEINCVDENDNIRTIEDIHEEIFSEINKHI